MQIGHATRTFNVPPGTSLGGYQPVRSSTDTHDQLELTVLVLADDHRMMSLVLIDLICVNRDLVEAVRRAIRAVSDQTTEVWVSASHTHSAPDVGCHPGGGSTPERWIREFTAAAAAGHRAAVTRLASSATRLTSVPLTGIGSVRADPATRHEVHADLLHWPGAPGILAVVPVHSTVLPQSNTQVSGDLHGAIRRHLHDSFDGWVAVAAGCAGDISTRWTRRGQDQAECDRLAGAAAGQLQAGLATTYEVAAESQSLGRIRETTLSLPERVDMPDRLAEGSVDPTPSEPYAASLGQARIDQTRRQGLDIARARSGAADSSIDLPLATAWIGDLLLASVGAEPFHTLRDRVWKSITPTSVVLGYTGGYCGYLPDAEGHRNDTYETLASPFRPEAEEQVLATLTQMAADAAETHIPSI